MKMFQKLLATVGVLGLVVATMGNGDARAKSGAAPNLVDLGEYTGETAPLFPRAFYDVNVTNPQTMRDFLWVIDSTYDLLISQGANAHRIKFVVSLRGLSVAFATQDYGIGDPQNEQVGIEIRQYLESLNAKGVRVEACQISCNWVGVDATTLHDTVLVIDNAFASSIWYQTHGYALIPIHQLPS
jgi:intracellular sulfur oxidation DsrE/DsrF family protein